MLPENLWGWYDGQTPVTLPSGRVITPPNRTYLKYNPDAFVGRVVTTPNGRIVADQFWNGNADITYDEIRTDNRFNIDMSIRREFRAAGQPPARSRSRRDEHPEPHAVQRTEPRRLNGGLGGTVTTANPALGLVPGMGNANNYGTRGMGDVQSAADHAARNASVLAAATRQFVSAECRSEHAFRALFL